MQDIAGDVQADTTLGRIRPGREAAGNRQGNGYGGGHESHYGRTGRSLREKATEAAGSTGEATPPAAGTDAHIPAE